MTKITRNRRKKRGPMPYSPIKFDYSIEPVAVEEFNYTNPTLKFLFGWLGINKPGIRKVELDDGQFFQAYPISPMIPDWSKILQGHVDVTGGYWAAINKGRPCLNMLEIDGPMTAKADHPMLQRIRDYRESGAPLKDDPAKWPEPYRTAWFDGE